MIISSSVSFSIFITNPETSSHSDDVSIALLYVPDNFWQFRSRSVVHKFPPEAFMPVPHFVTYSNYAESQVSETKQGIF